MYERRYRLYSQARLALGVQHDLGLVMSQDRMGKAYSTWEIFGLDPCNGPV